MPLSQRFDMILHVTNGDSAVVRMQETKIEGDILPWRDLLHEGPVPENLSDVELAKVRAQFISDRGWGDYADVFANFCYRDRLLAGFHAYEEVVLWFEHDLYDQLQLIQILDRFYRWGGGRTKLSIVQSDKYLGLSSSGEFHALLGSRQPVTRDLLALGHVAWTAFCSPDPHPLAALLNADTSSLPYLASAVSRHLEQFPDVSNGLCRTESLALEVMADRPITLAQTFCYLQEHEVAQFMGDWPFAWYLERLSRALHPLLSHPNGQPVIWNNQPDNQVAWWAQTGEITDAGQKVLNCRADHVHLNGIDRWLGGVHLQGNQAVWRWNRLSSTLIME